SAEAAAELAKQTDCRIWESHIDLAESRTIDAVVVATPPAFHGPIAIDFLQRGIPVLCEKTVSLTSDIAREIRQPAREHNALFTMASKFRYAEDVVRARNIVDSGILGEVV